MSYYYVLFASNSIQDGGASVACHGTQKLSLKTMLNKKKLSAQKP